mmetsp:Transcript_20046/g.45644  ORF Transcript_20046/g.45644 Transcript_20046/m.45644 type:complete len:143 (+) Transcript_20046:245-673(+)
MPCHAMRINNTRPQDYYWIKGQSNHPSRPSTEGKKKENRAFGAMWYGRACSRSTFAAVVLVRSCRWETHTTKTPADVSSIACFSPAVPSRVGSFVSTTDFNSCGYKYCAFQDHITHCQNQKNQQGLDDYCGLMYHGFLLLYT